MIDLPLYVARQLQNILPFPESFESDLALISENFGKAEERFRICASNVLHFAKDPSPDPWHIQKYPVFLYYLSRIVYEGGDADSHRLKDRLYCLNKALHGCSLHYKVALPSVFCVSYASGVVLGNCTYGENLIAYQGVTVGEYRKKAPRIGSNVVLMPNAVISGDTVLGNNVVVSAGVRVINKTIPDNSIVFDSASRELAIRPNPTMEYIEAFFLKGA